MDRNRIVETKPVSVWDPTMVRFEYRALVVGASVVPLSLKATSNITNIFKQEAGDLEIDFSLIPTSDERLQDIFAGNCRDLILVRLNVVIAS